MTTNPNFEEVNQSNQETDGQGEQTTTIEDATNILSEYTGADITQQTSTEIEM